MFGHGLYKGCGCDYGMCTCYSNAIVTPKSESFKKEALAALEFLRSVESENNELKAENKKLKKIAEEHYSAITDRAKEEAQEIVREAEFQFERLAKESLDKALLYKELAKGVKRSSGKSRFWEWLVRILPELDHSEVAEIVKDELEETYKIKF